jgi:hypothetical protein
MHLPMASSPNRKQRAVRQIASQSAVAAAEHFIDDTPGRHIAGNGNARTPLD